VARSKFLPKLPASTMEEVLVSVLIIETHDVDDVNFTTIERF